MEIQTVITGHRHNNIVAWRQFMVTDRIDSKRGLFHSSHSWKLWAGRCPRKSKRD